MLVPEINRWTWPKMVCICRISSMTARIDSGASLTVEHSSYPMDRNFAATDTRPATAGAIDNGSVMAVELWDGFSGASI